MFPYFLVFIYMINVLHSIKTKNSQQYTFDSKEEIEKHIQINSTHAPRNENSELPYLQGNRQAGARYNLR